MTVLESASEMRSSNFFKNKQLILGYRPMALSRNSACLRINNGQEQRKLSEYCMGNRADCCIMKRFRLIARICLLCTN